MRISSSNITMSATRGYQAETTQETKTITRGYDGDALQSTRSSHAYSKIKEYAVEASTAEFTSGTEGITREDTRQVSLGDKSSRQVDGNAAQPQTVTVPAQNSHWISSYSCNPGDDPELSFLMRLLSLLEKFSGKKYTSSEDIFRNSSRSALNGGSYQFSVSQATARYQETMVMFSAGAVDTAGQTINLAGRSTVAANGHWTRQVIQSGFTAGEENTAFTSKGTAVTADGRTIDFNISLEMSRSFESAYVSVGKEEVFTDPLVINLKDSPPELSDVSFYFDLNCDGVAEELSALDEGSGFLALDKNGDGRINDGSELFGAKTGDGFGELAAYDQDGNGWIDEGDEVFSRLSVWVKCGTGEAKQISLAEADVGAIFLGSQNTQYSLMDSVGETGAMIRKTGIYLKESGGAGTVQHVDFKA